MGDLPGGMFSHDSPCLIPDGRPTLHRSKPISLRSTPFGDGAQLLIDLREQRRDKLDGGGHRRLRSSQGCTLATSVEEVPDHDKKASKHYDSYWFVRD